MTTPAPFPPAMETAIAQALADHRYDGTRNWCICRVKVGYDLIAHQAAVVMETIAQHATTEWGRERPTNFRGGRRYVSPTAHRPASVEWDETLVARLVLPWQEVKA